MNEQAWHDWRRGGVGGSDIAALIGLSRYASPTSLFYEKRGLLEDRDEDTPRQRIGKRMESVLAAEFHDITGLHVIGEQTWCTHHDHNWARSTVDGFATESLDSDTDALLGTVQMKTDGRFGWPDGIPANVRAQCIWEMGVTGLRHCWLMVMFAGFRIEVFEIPWDADVESDWVFMLATASEFWELVQAGTPPPADDHEATTAALTEVFHDPAGMLDADDHARALVSAVQHSMALTAAAEATETRSKNELRALLGDKTDVVDGFKPARRKTGDPVPNVIASWRPQQSRKLDVTALRNAEPEIADKFTTESTVRVLRVPKLKED